MCEHDKVYSNAILTSYPPQRHWICRKCGEKGTDWLGSYGDLNEYDDLCEKFENET